VFESTTKKRKRGTSTTIMKSPGVVWEKRSDLRKKEKTPKPLRGGIVYPYHGEKRKFAVFFESVGGGRGRDPVGGKPVSFAPKTKSNGRAKKRGRKSLAWFYERSGRKG